MKTWISSWRQVMWALALAVVLARGAAAQSRPAETPTFQQRAAAKIAEFESAHKAVAGVSVVDVRTGKPLVAFRANELRSPASNQKLLTSAFALARLGGDFRFVTRVYLAGQDVVVLGDYDPTTGDPVLAEQAQKTVYDEPDRWAQAVKAQTQGVRNVYVIVRRDHEAFRHPDWPGGQHDKWYAAPVASLNFNNNCFDVTWAVETGAAVPTLTPSAAGIRVDNQVRVGPRHVWRLTTNADDSVVTLTGTIARGSSDPLSAAVNDPPLLLGRVLADRIARAGVTVAGGAVAIDRERVVIKPEAQPLCQTVTPLADAMARANKRSLNMAAECLFLRAGDGTWAGSAKLMSETLAKEFALPPESFTVRDGSGLSHGNRVSPAAVTKLLTEILRRKDADVLLDSLPISGTDGSIRGRLTSQPYRGRVLGKTGYIAGASCLSGYVLDRAGKPACAFSILVNRVPAGKGWKAHELQEDLCRMLVDELDK